MNTLAEIQAFLKYFRDDKQLLEAEKIMVDVVFPIGDELFDKGVGEMSFSYGSTVYFNAYIFK